MSETATSLPSDLIEPALEQAVGLCIRQLLQSSRDDAAWRAFANQVKGIGRVALCNADGSTGVHASLAANNALMMAEKALAWPDAKRHQLLAIIDQHNAATPSLSTDRASSHEAANPKGTIPCA